MASQWRVGALILLSVLLAVGGCAKEVSLHAPRSGLVTAGAGGGEGPQRFVATRHRVEISTTEKQLPKAWEAVITFCGTIRCEVLSSSITTKTSGSMPWGSISLRTAPEDLQKLLAHIETQGTIVQHTTENEDKTLAVVDTEAKLKNLTSFRDSLRTMQAKPSVTVKDLVEIQKQLTDVQSQLDSETTQRKILANETEKVAVDLMFRVEAGRNTGIFAPIREAFSESGRALAESIAALITVIVSVIPWLVLIVPGSWLLIRFWRKRRKARVGFTAAGPQ